MPTLKVWNGSEWEYLTGGAAILQQDAAPGSPVEGDLWIDTDATPSGSDVWADYVPTHTGVTVGNGTQVARYTQSSTTVHVRYSLTFGSTSAFAATVEFGLPVAASGSGRAGALTGIGYTLDSGTAENMVVIKLASGSSSKVVGLRPSDGGAVATGVPFNWTTNDVFTFSITYEAA